MNGIGGRTIAEAQANLSYPEFLVWCKFRRKRGSLNQGWRIEQAVARLQALYVNLKLKPDAQRLHWEDFAPHADERVITLAEAMEQWK